MNRLYKWRRPRSLGELIIVLTLLAAIAAILALLSLTAKGAVLFTCTILCVVCMLLYLGLFTLDASALELLVLSIPARGVISARIDSAIELSMAYNGIKEGIKDLLKRRFKGEYTEKRTFLLSSLQTTDTWLFLNGDLRLHFVQGYGKLTLRVEWLTREAKEKAKRLEHALSSLDYQKAASSKMVLAKCPMCGTVKPRKGSGSCPQCNLLLESPLSMQDDDGH